MADINAIAEQIQGLTLPCIRKAVPTVGDVTEVWFIAEASPCAWVRVKLGKELVWFPFRMNALAFPRKLIWVPVH